tara:strand:+ start:278 stop:1279 length:1002 start_codon:yes stop_codon:yes gene_type:complete
MKRILEITTRIGCSNMCEYCPQAKLIKNYKNNLHGHRIEKRFTEHLDFKVLQKMLVHDYLKNNSNRETQMTLGLFMKYLKTIPSDVDIHFTGYTEPFENPQCLDMIDHVLGKGHRVLINTTLVGMDKASVDRLEEIVTEYPGRLIKEINFHLPSKKYHENIGRTTRAEKEETGKEISDDYLDLIDYINKHKLTSSAHGSLRIGWHAHGGVHPEIAKVHPKVASRGLNSRAGNLGKLTGKALWEKNWCARIYHNVLLPDGSVQLCCQDYGLDEPLGNLKDMDYEELHNTNKFKDISDGGAVLCQKCDDGVAVSKEGRHKLRHMQDYEDEWRKKR